MQRKKLSAEVFCLIIAAEARPLSSLPWCHFRSDPFIQGNLTHSAVKLKSWNNLIAKRAGTSWGASASTLRTSALALCYSVAEYCCPMWARSSYTNLIDTQLHSCMRLISGCLPPTQVSWLPVLTNVAPASLCRKAVTDNMHQIIEAHPNWPVYADVFEHPPPRLASRHPIWSHMITNTITNIFGQ